MTARRAKNTNRQGANFELQIMEHLRKRGYDVLRSSGSRGKVDVVAVGDYNLLFIQAKITNPVIAPAERKAVREMAARADAVPLVSYRIKGHVMFRELTGDGPKEFELFWPATHPWVECQCGHTYNCHDVNDQCVLCADCESFAFVEKESK